MTKIIITHATVDQSMKAKLFIAIHPYISNNRNYIRLSDIMKTCYKVIIHACPQYLCLGLKATHLTNIFQKEIPSIFRCT